MITASIHNAANSDELYLRTDTVEIAAAYEGPGNRRPQITTSELRFNENPGSTESATGTVIGMVEATDADNDDNALVYSLEPLNTIFGINAGSGEVTISAARNFNYESGPREYPLTVKVVDPYGDSVKREVNVVITDINEAPVLAAIANDRAIIGHGYELILPTATDEDTGQSYTYTAVRTSDGSALPSWLGFDGTTRKFTIAEDAVGVVAATYQISVVVVDNGSPQLRDSETFALTVVEAGVIETVAPGVLERTAQSQALSVRLSAQPDTQVTVSLVVDAAVAAVAPNELVFTPSNWNGWQSATVSISAATYESKDDIDFVITASIHNAANSDELYLRTDAVEIATEYDGPGNDKPRIITSELQINENPGTTESARGTLIGMVEARDDDNNDNLLVYSLEPVNTIFGINAGSGEVTISAARNFNYESGTTEYPLTVKVADPYGDSVKREVNVVITDINEAPQFPALQDIYQATRRGSFSISPATDPDAGDSLAYTASLPGSWLTFQSSDLRFAIALNAPLGMHTITITATDTGGLSVKEEFALEVLVAPNADPSFARARAEFEIVLDGNELTVPVGIVIGTVSATDPDADRLTYRIMPTDVRVRINSQSGAIETAQELAPGVYQFTVEAADGKGGTARIAVRLVVRTGDDMEEQVALTVIDRSTAMAATDIIHRHLETPLSQPETLTAADSTDSEQLPAYLRMASDVEQWQDWRYDHESHAAQSERTQLRDFLYNRGFDFSFAGSGPRARALRVWGAGSRDALNGTPEIDDEQVAYDGNTSLFMVGAETSMSRTRMGIAAGRAKTKLALANTKSRVQRQLNSIHPYLSFQASDQLQLWATGGFGRGDLVVLEDSGNQNTRNARNVSAAGGFKVNWKRAKINLAAGMNMLAMQSRLAADRDRALPASISRFWRTNLDFNVSRAFAPTAEISFRPFVGAQIRRDGGDNWLDMRALDATAGIDINWIRGLSAKITSRYQINKGEFRERNVNGSISYDMDSDRRGLMLSVSPSMASSNDASFSRSLSARAGYGLPMRLFADSGLTTISTDFSSTETGSGAYSYGLSFAGRRLQVDLTAAGETLTGRISIR